jgi:hypothetical protein
MKTHPIHEGPIRFMAEGPGPGELFRRIPRTFNRNARIEAGAIESTKKEWVMGDITGLAVVIMLFGIPITGMALYTWYRVSKLRTEERLAALARGVNIPMEPELSQSMRSRRSGILLVAGAIGYVITFTLIARVEPDAWVVASFGAIPFTLGLGYFLDSTLIRRDLRSSS